MIFINNVTTKHISEADGIHFAITKQEVKNMNLRRARQVLKTFEDAGKQGRNKLMISFMGYAHTPKEVYEIKEVRKFAEKLFNEFPHIFYFLSDMDGSKIVFLLCLCDETTIKRTSPLNVTAVSSEYINRKIIDGILDYGTKIGESKTDLWKIIDDVLDPKPNMELFRVLAELARDIDLFKMLESK